MSWKNANEIIEDVYDTLIRVRTGQVSLRQAAVEARLLDTGARLTLALYPVTARTAGVNIKAA